LNRTCYDDEDLAWGSTGTKNEQEEKFFTPLESLGKGELKLERVDHNLEVQVDKTTPFKYAHLEVNSCFHVVVVEQLMNWINLNSKQFLSSNQFVIQITHYKKQ
jgi:hypothetical protein